ncbi:epoxyqueuosine reductase [Novimethylophilus kurashikiensis]|uniref:Epoxyqueuosine reductase n=1 Tax=Novimethylophilus kurashikiensis TaxID=1825523 RepID=A0A2R5FDL5_9PROT|nr:tRNA epoxyqueuosine(34) reductase QueG [Novimethylophilus kurashikiensis]GBG14711.1 epoxyqueuosine reductase [Novimethylophilus kurashikiensis]
MQSDSFDFSQLASDIKAWGHALGFQAIGICDTDLSQAEPEFTAWLEQGFHGEMDYMARHGLKRLRPAELVPGTRRVITARMDYLPEQVESSETVMQDASRAFISRYALGRDYHKVLRSRLQQLCDRIAECVGEFGYRVFTDSAPVAEVHLAEKSGIGWRGKHTLLLSRDAGSWFFLGEIFTDLPLPADEATTSHCGSCSACITACPTGAIVAPYQVDARRCISYLTIELQGSIPEQLRPLMGNRIYGCDDCQLCCPWNKFAQLSVEPDFQARHGLDAASLRELFAWDQSAFETMTAGSAIRRIGHERWLRNIAVALGNAETAPENIAALESRADHPSPLVQEHVSWALARLRSK